MRCLSCKYNLRNLPEPRCPECGRMFDPTDSRTFHDPTNRKNRWWIEVSICCAVTYLLLTVLLVLDERGVLVSGRWRFIDLGESLSSMTLRSAGRALISFPLVLPFGLAIYYLWRNAILWTLRRRRPRL